MKDSEVKAELKVRTTKLEDTQGMLIAQRHLSVRKEGITGTVLSYVPGHGGDVWFVKHDGTGEVGAYTFTELERVQYVKNNKEQEGKEATWVREDTLDTKLGPGDLNMFRARNGLSNNKNLMAFDCNLLLTCALKIVKTMERNGGSITLSDITTIAKQCNFDPDDAMGIAVHIKVLNHKLVSTTRYIS